MFILSNLLSALAQLLNFVLSAFSWLIIIRVLLSWVSPDPANPIVQFIHQLSEPVLYRIRKMLPFALRFSALDLSPIIALLLIMFIKAFLVRTLLDWAIRL